VPTKATLEAWIIAMRERGMSPSGCNVHVRSVNSFLTYLYEEGELANPLKLKLLKSPKRLHALLTPQDVRSFVSFKPRNYTQRRTWVLVLLLLDTGCRITEAAGGRGRARMSDSRSAIPDMAWTPRYKADLRAVLHDQATGTRHGAWPCDCLWHCQAERRVDLGGQPAR
jgi:hypothetical protein